MPLLKPVKKDAVNDRAQGVIDAADRTIRSLEERLPPSSTLSSELEALVARSFPLPSSTLVNSESAKFDELGSRLWNAATKINRSERPLDEPRVPGSNLTHLVAVLRIFSLLLLDTAYRGISKRDKGLDQNARVFKVGLKACRFCLETNELQLAQRGLESCSDYAGVAEEASPIVKIASEPGNNRGLALEPLVLEYYLLRMTHALRSERLDLAEHFASKVPVSTLAVYNELAEKAAELYYEAGRLLSKKHSTDTAIAWFDRAVNALDSCDIERRSQDGIELRLGIAAALVDVLIAQNAQESLMRARSVVDQLRITHAFGDNMAVSLMQFNILAAQSPTDATQISTLVSSMIQHASLTEQIFRTLVRTIHRVKRINAELACLALSELIRSRLIPGSPSIHNLEFHQDMLEKSMITYIMFVTTTSCKSPIVSLESLQALLDTVIQQTKTVFSAKATHAAQTLLWKSIGASDDGRVEQWCVVLRHPLFDAAGSINKARIGRKAMLTALDRGNLDAARAAYFQMPASAQDESISRYLAYKVALLSKDHQLATESLNSVLRHADKDQTFLYACVLEAQQSASRQMAVAALQAILEESPPGVHMLSLLRCTARLIISELESHKDDLDDVVHELMRVFEAAALNIKGLRHGSGDQWRLEMQWWSKNAFNVSLKLCAEISPKILIRLLRVCVKFLDCYSDDASLAGHGDPVHKKMICCFLIASANIVLGRSSEGTAESHLQCYLEARREVEMYMALRRQIGERKEKDQLELMRSFELLKFDLEAILTLQQWDQLDGALDACLQLENVDRWETLADLAVVIHEQTKGLDLGSTVAAKIPEVLQRTINETWRKDRDIVKVARWTRITFTIDLSDGDTTLSHKLLIQAGSLAKKGQEGRHDPYPDDELQWLSMTAFNRAVDLLSAGDNAGAVPWLDGSLDLARYSTDNGSLHALLTRNRQQANERMGNGGVRLAGAC